VPLAIPFLSVVIPAYNEETRISATLSAVLDYLRAQKYTWEIVVVDDGSVDATSAFVNSVVDTDDRVCLERIPHGGKGWAVRHGMLAATGELRFMCDADLAMPIPQISRFIDQMSEGYDLVIGSREGTGSRRYDESASRHFRGRIFNLVVRLLAVRRFQDTQCGFKCFRSTAAEGLFASQRTTGFGFDVELLYLASKRDLRVLEMPIEWHHQEESTVRFVDAFLMLRDVIMVRLRDVRGDYGK
jgi:dolichyl-phosphate beta-glucosyltransferase